MTLEDYIAEDGEFLQLDGHENALVGIVTGFGMEPRLCYDRDLVIKNLMADMSEEEAEEFFEFNIIGAWVGDRTPVFIHGRQTQV